MTRLLTLFAQTPYHNRLEGLRGAFNERERDPADMTGALILVGAVIAIVILWVILRKATGSQPISRERGKPGKIFNRILRSFGLNWRERLVMGMFARESGMKQPAIVFFDEDLFERQTEQWIETMAFTSYKSRAKQTIERVRVLAFPKADASIQ